MSLNPTDSGTVDSGVKDPGSTPIWSSPGEGGSGGNPFDDFQPSLGGVTEIRVWADKYIDAIQVAYVDTVTPKHGGGGGHAYTFFLDTDEKIVKINGRGSKYIDQLQFFTDIEAPLFTVDPVGIHLAGVRPKTIISETLAGGVTNSSIRFSQSLIRSN